MPKLNQIQHNKLVRDRIPEVIRNNGDTPITRTLTLAEYELELYRKLQEEVDEFRESGSPDELADILEVVYALAENSGLEPSQLDEIRAAKYRKRGGFQKRIFLIETH